MTEKKETYLKSVKFEYTAQITLQQIDDLMITAIEGGSNYWYEIGDLSKVKTPDGFIRHEEVHYEFLDKAYQGASVPVFDRNEESLDLQPLGYINMVHIKKGLEKLSKDYSRAMNNIVTEQYDADDADLFFQLVVMGDVVFC